MSEAGVANRRVGRAMSWVAAASRLLIMEVGMGVLERAQACCSGARRRDEVEGEGHAVDTQSRREGSRGSVAWEQMPRGELMWRTGVLERGEDEQLRSVEPQLGELAWRQDCQHWGKLADWDRVWAKRVRRKTTMGIGVGSSRRMVARVVQRVGWMVLRKLVVRVLCLVLY